MKILILSDGNNTHTRRWVKSLSQNNTIILFSFCSIKDNFYEDIPNTFVETLNLKRNSSILDKFKYLKAYTKLKKIIKKYNPNIIHAHYASSYGLLGALTKNKIPYFLSVWGSDVYDFPKKNFIFKKILQYNLKKADKILSTSKIMAKETLKYIKKDICILPFGVDTTKFFPIKQNINPEAPIIIGNIKTLKNLYGIDTLIEAMSIVIKNNPQKNIRLQIYGEGPMLNEYLSLTRQLGIQERVEFKGFVDNEKLPEIYNTFTVFVTLSRKESFGVVALEAMSCKIPVLASDAPGYLELIKNGESGLIVPKNNPEAAAQAIQKLIDNPDLRNHLADNGRKEVINNYEWDKNVEEMCKIYNSIE